MFWSWEKLSLLVDGWMRENIFIGKDINYEATLTILVVNYSLISDHFEHCNHDRIEVNKEKNTIKQITSSTIGGDLSTVYCPLKIPSMSKSRSTLDFLH